MERHQLTDNFFLDEFTFSSEAARRGKEIPLEVGSPVYHAVRLLCEQHLQPLRAALGPVTITSGYRPPWLNRLIGGSASSQQVRCGVLGSMLERTTESTAEKFSPRPYR